MLDIKRVVVCCRRCDHVEGGFGALCRSAVACEQVGAAGADRVCGRRGRGAAAPAAVARGRHRVQGLAPTEPLPAGGPRRIPQHQAPIG